jgi:hypothetical protein
MNDLKPCDTNIIAECVVNEAQASRLRTNSQAVVTCRMVNDGIVPPASGHRA